MGDIVKDVAPIGRRNFLLASGMAAAVAGATLKPAKAFAQTTPQDALATWKATPSIPLWPNRTPESGFSAKELPKDWPATFLRNVDTPTLRVFRPEKPNGRSLLVMPGGAYTFVSIDNEGVQIAHRMNALGYTVFVLLYRLPGEGWTHRENVPLQDAQRAMRIIRDRSATYQCDPEQIYAVGFSAGGHLAATLVTAFDEQVYAPSDSADALTARPRAAGLIYPVISQVEGIGHAESTQRLLGKHPTMEATNMRSPAYHVTAQTPPCFLVHALDDPAVPPENSIMMLQALRTADRPCEAHFFEEGGHGFGPSQPELPASEWIDLFGRWLNRHAA